MHKSFFFIFSIYVPCKTVIIHCYRIGTSERPSKYSTGEIKQKKRILKNNKNLASNIRMFLIHICEQQTVARYPFQYN